MKISSKIDIPPLTTIIALATSIAAQIASANECGRIDQNNIRVLKDAVIFRTPLFNVDADGAPNSYLENGKGLSFTCDGVAAIENGRRVKIGKNTDWEKKCNDAWAKAKKSGNYKEVAIFGFLKDRSNNPVLQYEGDPLPNTAFISTTSVVIPGEKDGTQRRYVDATKIPYIVLPAKFNLRYGVKPGSVALVYRKKTNVYAFAVYGDNGNFGEGSVKLHQDLKSNPIVNLHGVDRAKRRIDDSIFVAVFPKQIARPDIDASKWNSEILKLGEESLDSIGGIEKIKACSREYVKAPTNR